MTTARAEPAPAVLHSSEVQDTRMVARLRLAAFLVLWTFVFTIPSTSVVLTGGSAGTVSRLVGLLAVPVAAGAIIVGGRRLRLTDAHLLLTVLAIWAFVSAFWTIDVRLTESLSSTVGQLWLLVLLVWEFGFDRRRWRLLLWAYVLGCLVGGAQVFSALASGAAYGTGRFTAGGFNPGDLSQILLLGIPLAWYLSLDARTAAARALALLYLPVGITAVLLTASRTALLIAPVALAIIPLTMSTAPRRGRVAAVVGLAFSILALGTMVPDSTLERLETIPGELVAGDLNGRTELWEATIDTIDANPVIGVGVGALPSAIEADTHRLQGSHNTYLAVTGDLGVIGLALFLLAFLAIAIEAVRLPRKERALSLVVLALVLCTWIPSHNQYEKATWLAMAFAMAPLSRLARFQTGPAAAGSQGHRT